MIHFVDGTGTYFVLPGVRDNLRELKKRSQKARKHVVVVGESQPFLIHLGPGRGQRWVKLTGRSAMVQPSSHEEWLEWNARRHADISRIRI